MYKNSKLAIGLAAALLIGTAAIAQASDNNSGGYHGGNLYGPEPGQIFGLGQGGTYAYGGPGPYAYAGPDGTGGYAYGTTGYDGGSFAHGIFIPRGTSPAQVPPG